MTAQATTEKPKLLDGYISDEELRRELGGARPLIDRTTRKWRQSGEGPPFVKIGHDFYYPLDEFRKWLKKRTRTTRG
jgi:hypothetical protein